MALVAWTRCNGNRNYCRRLLLAVWLGEVGTTEGTSTTGGLCGVRHARELCGRNSVLGANFARQHMHFESRLLCGDKVSSIERILES